MGNYKINYDNCYKNNFKNNVQAAVKFYLELGIDFKFMEDNLGGFILYPQALNPFLRIMETMGESQNIVILPALEGDDSYKSNAPAYMILKLDLKSSPIYTISSLNPDKVESCDKGSVYSTDGTKFSIEKDMSFESLLLGLIEINKKQREIFKSNKLNYSAIDYAKEFCTIRLDIGRGVGKTNFINKHAKKGDLIVTYNSKSVFHREHCESDFEYDVISLYGNNDMCHKLSKKNYTNIFVEEPSIISSSYPDFIKDLYNFLVDPNIEQTFIILGN